MGWASIGSDTGGSIRIPASACGVVGLKPAFGEVPMVGVVPLSVSLDHVGPIARNVTDAWAIHDALAGARRREPSSGILIGDLRLGRLTGYFLEKLDEDVRARMDEAITRLKEAGAAIVDIDLGRVPDIARTYLNVALPEAFAYHAEALTSVPDKFSESVRTRLQTGATVSRDDYVRAQADRAQLRASVDAALSRCDALVLATMPIPPQKIGATTALVNGAEEPLRPLTLRHTQLFNLTGHPAISLPCGNTRDGVPCGFQMVGRHKHTPDLLGVALTCEPVVTPRALSSSEPL
jgi:aspartyl-tRNA(Asn)/glutamyl-tRNA(Gln) amidotransferase subunit A